MSARRESEPLKPLTIGEAFPVGDFAGEWVMLLTMTMNDLVTLDDRVHSALTQDRHDGGYYFRLLCGTLREIWRLFDVADKKPEITAVVDGMAPEAIAPYARVRALFVRPPSDGSDGPQASWAEQHLKDVRDRTFHYPHVGSDELRAGMSASTQEQARIRLDTASEAAPMTARPFEFADVVAMTMSFGNIDREEEREKFNEITATSKEILRDLVPVVLSALGTYLRARGTDPRRLSPEAAEARRAERG